MPADLEDLPADLEATFFEFLTMYDENLKNSKNPQKIHMWLRAIKKIIAILGDFWAFYDISKILVDLKDMPHASQEFLGCRMCLDLSYLARIAPNMVFFSLQKQYDHNFRTTWSA